MITDYSKQILLISSLLFCSLCFPLFTFSQIFSVNFPIGSTVYQGSQLSLTVLIEGVTCDNTVIKSHRGHVSMVNRCQYLYSSSSSGVDTIEVFVRKRNKLKLIGQQVFVVKERPLPVANIAGKKEGSMKKGELLAQQGVGGSWFIGGNHWENCTIENFNFIIFRNNNVIVDIFNKGNLFTTEVRAVMQKIEIGDKVLITNIKGCLAQGGGNLKTLDFIIE